MVKIVISSSVGFKVAHCSSSVFSHDASNIQALFALTKNEMLFDLVDVRGRMDNSYVSDAFLLARSTKNFLEKEGFVTVFFVDIYAHGSLRDFRSSLNAIMKLGSAGLLKRLNFSLRVSNLDRAIFSANCDTLTEIPPELPEKVLEAILSKNPDMEEEKLLDSVFVNMRVSVPCLELEPVGVDLEDPEKDFEFVSGKTRYACVVADGYSFFFNGIPTRYIIG